MKSVGHEEIIEIIHRLSGVEKYKVRLVIRALPRVIRDQLKIGVPATIWGLGQFKLIKKRVKKQPHIRIVFRGAAGLKKTLGREHKRKKGNMEKYGVELDKGKEVNARIKETCPSCGTKLDKDAGGEVVCHCPNCGSKPLEKRKDK